jgi:hypothetical protein
LSKATGGLLHSAVIASVIQYAQSEMHLLFLKLLQR